MKEYITSFNLAKSIEPESNLASVSSCQSAKYTTDKRTCRPTPIKMKSAKSRPGNCISDNACSSTDDFKEKKKMVEEPVNHLKGA